MVKDQNLSIEEVIAKAALYLNEKHIAFITGAYEFARDSHAHQIRKSGEPYIIHPIQVAGILVDLEMDPNTIAAGFLHDVIEDTDVTLDDIAKAFNNEVAMLVDGVTKLGKIKFKSHEEQQAENHRKMFLAMAEDIRVILIKLADRVHNMRTLKHLPPEKQKRIAQETLDIFAPLAHRLGISMIKWELEDTALRYINPQQYYRIVHLMKQKRGEREAYLDELVGDIEENLTDLNIKADISGRPKHIFSIYHKMTSQHKQFNEIYDLLAIRVIVDSIKDCYAVLGIIHTRFKPMPGRFKDYIAMPKANMYQSLHTTVIGPGGEPLEVQIRTQEMHQIAEFGVAAHWAYKEGNSANLSTSIDRKMSWFSEIMEVQDTESNAQEFMSSLKTDLFADMVYVFSPKGDVIELPKGSVPLDFAYRVHTEVGNRTVGAKINGKIVTLDYKLQTGDIVDILTSKTATGPSRDWLKLVQSSQAKNKIRQYFKRLVKDETVEKGKESLEKELLAHSFDPKEFMTDDNLAHIIDRFNFRDEDDLYAAIGYNSVTALQIMNRLTEKVRRERALRQQADNLIVEGKTKAGAVTQSDHHEHKNKNETGIDIAGGMDNLMLRLSHCCNPVPGDEIIGFITKGHGISIHRQDCPNVTQLEDGEDRLIDVSWSNNDLKSHAKYEVTLEVYAFNRDGLLNDVIQTLNSMQININGVNARLDKREMAALVVNVMIRNKEEMQRVIDKLKQIYDVYTVRRVTK
ncbi:bifunctional (p)ppGpp synthetase/guanosine-3',5'-bis(diphosphate) 3'-pyrophosphohydrolase [Brochothrix thermosphacta]|uniref:RelA/SpoT family protein n=1 Tax=Brochothrix thermosphacta TaxID=2756 RepID=UPI00271231A7|nr:bifunctional (p)ppGpp synthetase/guanosine-3',5'-bis(diphosphate) 3'-pyrophosphohydrolase [Brochothrix thermosphacta]MDO7863458.1 bifunctional (p)ppGpp synthetase/guanosine-3',5'-bis(diphosphate) 3'-pyrophosphohydrolase [Brochothrix thermosphacta]